MVERDAQAALARLGEPQPTERPVLVLQLLGGKAIQVMDVFEALVRELSAAEIVTTDNFGAEQVRAVLAGLGDAMDRVHRIHADLVRLGLEERAQRLEEVQARRVWEAIDAALVGSVPADVLPAVRVAVGRAFAELGPVTESS